MAAHHFQLERVPACGRLDVRAVQLGALPVHDLVHPEVVLQRIHTTDVVVVGYGKSSRANLTSAQSTVSAKDIEKYAIKVPNITLQVFDIIIK